MKSEGAGMPGPSGLGRSHPKETGLHGAGNWLLGFLIFVTGGAGLYAVEGYLAGTGALPTIVIYLLIWGYIVWLLVTLRAWSRRGRE